MPPSSTQSELAQAMRLHQSGRLAEAEALYRRILSASPQNDDALQMLGVLANQTNRPVEALELLQRATHANPRAASCFNNLGLVLMTLKRTDEAIAAFNSALELQPNFPEVLTNLGTAFRAKGQIPEAISAYRKALALRPNYPAALNNLASALRADGQDEAAIATYRQAIALKPDYVEAWENLGNLFRTTRRLDEAIAAYQKILELRPNSPGTLTSLGRSLKDVARLDQAIECFRKSLAMQPDARTGEDLLYTLHFQSDDQELIYQEHVKWNRQFAQPLAPIAPVYVNDPSPERKLRIGYVSPDFRGHCQAFFVVPLLSNHDSLQFETFCYSNVETPDATTASIRSYADHWRDITKLSDEEAAELVRQDGIDILVDLTLHMDRSRPLVFARKPAPIQVTWLGYPSTTGMTAIDYRISDPYSDPEGGKEERFYAEKTVRLPETFWCYDPLITGIEVNELPVLRNGYITFGCLNNFCKVTDRTLELWGKVLNAVTNSRLLLLAPRGFARDRVRQHLGGAGVSESRLEFIDYQPRQTYLELYRRIDVCLDTIPYPGHTTTIDALWMGVLTVTLAGRNAPSRGGLSILSNVGLTNLIAHDAEDYVRIMRELLGNLDELARLRASLRTRIEASPLMDAPRFARNMEEAYRTMWREWCSAAQ